MGRITNLTVDLDADGRKEARALRQSQREWKRYSQQVSRDLQGVSRAATVGAAAVTAGSVAAIQSSIRLGDETAKAARNAGLSATAYQTLRHAFEEAGASGQVLVKATTTLSNRILDLDQGTKETVDAFAALGLGMSDLSGQTPDAALRLVVDRLSEIDDEARQSALAAELFGGAARKMGTIVEQGTAALDAAAEEATRFGLVLSTQATSSAEALNDQMALLATAVRTQFAEGVLSAIGSTEDLDAIILEVAQSARSFGEGLIEVSTALYEHRDVILLVVGAWAAWKTAIVASGIVKGVQATVVAVGALKTVLAGSAFIKAFAAALALVSAPVLAIGAAIGALVAGIVIFREELLATIRPVQDFFAALRDTALDFFKDAIDSLPAPLQRVIRYVSDAARYVTAFLGRLKTRIVEAFSSAISAVRSHFADFTVWLRDATGGLVDFTGESASAASAADTLADSTRGSTRAFQRWHVEADRYVKVTVDAKEVSFAAAEAAEELAAQLGAGAAIAEHYNNVRDRANQLVEQGRTAVERLREEEALLLEAIRLQTGDRGALNRALADTQERIRDLTIETASFADQFAWRIEQAAEAASKSVQRFGITVADIMIEATGQVGDAFAAWIFEGESFADAMKGIMKRVLANIVSAWAEATLHSILFGSTSSTSILGSFSGMWSSLKSIAGNVFSGLGNLFSGSFSGAFQKVAGAAKSLFGNIGSLASSASKSVSGIFGGGGLGGAAVAGIAGTAGFLIGDLIFGGATGYRGTPEDRAKRQQLQDAGANDAEIAEYFRQRLKDRQYDNDYGGREPDPNKAPRGGAFRYERDLLERLATSYHTGGIVPGPSGSETLALLQAGEAVLTQSQQRALMAADRRGGVTVNIQQNLGGDLTDEVIRVLRTNAAEIGALLSREVALPGRV